MGFGWNTRSAEDVQHHNGRAYTFGKIAKRYEEIVPLRGKRKAQDIRPHGERARCWERIAKVNDQEYYLTNNAYSYYDKYGYTPSRAITFKRDDEGNETIIVHTPRQYWGDKPEDRQKLMPKQLGVPSYFFFYNYNLPDGLGMHKYHNKNYLEVQNSDNTNDTSFYILEKGDVVVTRQVGEKYFKPLIVHREVYRKLDRTKTKALREELKDFKEYVRIMLPLTEHARHGMYETPIRWAMRETDPSITHYGQSDFAKECHGKGWRGLFTGEPSDLWFKLVQYYKYQCRTHTWNSATRDYVYIEPSPQTVMNLITNQVYAVEKPLHEEPVELGVRTFDKYRNW